MLIRPWTLILLGLASVLVTVLVTLLPGHPGVVSQATSRLGFSPERVLDPFPPLTAPPTIPAHEANGLIEPGESVLGVEIGGEARTYPIDMIQYINKEVLNDALGDLPIAVSWCDLCQSGVVYDRKVDERALTFRVAGMIWQGNMVMEDLETRTFWSQLTGEALQGDLAGATLASFPATLTTWRSWRARFPNTSVLLLDRAAITPPQTRGVLAHRDRIPPRLTDDFLLGLACEGEAAAWSLAYLQSRPVLNEEHCGQAILMVYDHEEDAALAYRRVVDEIVLTFRQEQDGKLVDEQTGTVWEPGTGRGISGPLTGSTLEPVDATLSCKETWRKFYPDASIVGLGGG